MESDQYEAGIAAEQNAKNDVSKVFWFIVGLILNILGVFIAYAYQPSGPVKRIFGKSLIYSIFYERIYKSGRRKIQVKWAFIGCIIEFPIALFFLLLEYLLL
ncbi:hypothetical protein JT359_03660 [Candidatus Poribacteria bacterium]|nr:hypothetical protein [Candidatus Poribacteria bacterium]